MDRPILGISMGDPFGNGPEITVRALANKGIYDRCRPLVVGDMSSMDYALRVAKKVRGATLTLNPVKCVEEAKFTYGTIDVLDLGLVAVDQIPDTADQDVPQPFGIGACRLGGEASFRYVEKVIQMAMAGEIDATVTNALAKEAINMAGHHYSGHTEIYADYTKTDKYTMMLAHNDLRVVHVSTHVSLREACDLVKKERVLECIRIANEGCKALGIEKPKIGVAEKKPTPPDTVFSKALGGWYDIVVVMYHDQGHIPLKVKGFVYNKAERHWDAVAGINVTLGLPIIRASVDHGTGFGHAGNGHANELSLVNAMDYAITLANHKKR